MALLLATSAAAGETVMALWPGPAPGEVGPLPPESDLTKPTDELVAGRPLVRLSNVTRPEIVVCPPMNAPANGAVVIVCPGGGYGQLAMDLEGTEVRDWLDALGVTTVILKYRVPRREGREKHAAPLQDLQRAISLVRNRAADFGLDPGRIGVLGFSAGGHLAAMASNQFGHRTYPALDGSDRSGCRPDFCILVYPAYLATRDESPALVPELQVTCRTPPTFLIQTQDDPVGIENTLCYFLALQRHAVAAEVHVYPSGGHGYGLRRTGQAVTTWPQRAADWLREGGWLADRH